MKNNFSKSITMKTIKLCTLLLFLLMMGCGNAQNNGCWLSLKELTDYGPDTHKPEYVLAAHSDVVSGRFDITSDVELISNDSVRISGTVIDAETGEGALSAFLPVDKCIDNVYTLSPNKKFYSDMDGSFSFTIERKDRIMYIIDLPGYDPVLLMLNCCDECTKKDKRHSSHTELKH